MEVRPPRRTGCNQGCLSKIVRLLHFGKVASGGPETGKNRMNGFKGIMLAGAMGLSSAGMAQAADDTIKVGVLHSLSGTMAISETTLKDTVLMMIDEQNKKGGLLGKKLEAVVVDPASNWPLFAEKASSRLHRRQQARFSYPSRRQRH